MELNDYSYGIVIPLFGKNLFIGIVIPIVILIPLRRGIYIHFKNERNTYFFLTGIELLQHLLIKATHTPTSIFYLFFIF
jgi:hypothetical protein